MKQKLTPKEQPIKVFREYQGGHNMPLGGYSLLLGTYFVTFLTLLAKVKSRDGLPDAVPFRDIALLGVAAHKVARHITNDAVTSPVRAYFNRYGHSASTGEVSEVPRRTGLARAVGELLSCPWCAAGWCSMGFGFSYAFNPRLTRFVASIFTIEALADFLHIAYDAAKRVEAH